jgi:hypothetical protein
MEKNYECIECMKKYTSYKSFWNHNKKYHVLNNELHDTRIKQIENNGVKCKYCKRFFTNKYTLIKHEVKCDYIPIENIETTKDLTKIKLEIELELRKEKNKVESTKDKEIELELIKEKNKELELKITLEKLLADKCKMHPKTFSALNKILINKSINSNNTNTNYNNTINNYYNIVGFGYENLVDVLTQTEKKQIMKSRFSCLEEIIKIAHCSNYKQFKNIIITNLKDNIAYKYDNQLKYFISIDKNELVNELIDNRVCDIGEIYNELIENNKLDSTTSKLIKEFIEKINSDSDYKSQQNNNLRILLYNNREHIINDINSIVE